MWLTLKEQQRGSWLGVEDQILASNCHQPRLEDSPKTGPCVLGWLESTKETFASSPSPRLRFFEAAGEAIILQSDCSDLKVLFSNWSANSKVSDSLSQLAPLY